MCVCLQACVFVFCVCVCVHPLTVAAVGRSESRLAPILCITIIRKLRHSHRYKQSLLLSCGLEGKGCVTLLQTHMKISMLRGVKSKSLRRNSRLKYSWHPSLHSETHACDSPKSYSSLFGGLYLTQALSSLVPVAGSGCFRGRVGEKKRAPVLGGEAP